MKVTMKKKDIQDFWRGLNVVAQGDHNRLFAYAIGRNLQKLRPIIRLLEVETKPLESFERSSMALARLMAKRDEKGNPVQIPGNVGLAIDDPPAFQEKLEAIRESTGQKKRDEEVAQLLESEEEIDIYMIDFERVPETMKGAVFETLMPMIREPNESEKSEE